jgi:hypothetical protein
MRCDYAMACSVWQYPLVFAISITIGITIGIGIGIAHQRWLTKSCDSEKYIYVTSPSRMMVMRGYGCHGTWKEACDGVRLMME